ncbi:peptidoglycan -binding protein [Rhodobacteraceae bacterium]|nr:peptidoglycan -binding protein [Paracoccaceae bacterium]MDC1255181.1 peptidoglycan -binding protein [Paracoccaceae bacterium]
MSLSRRSKNNIPTAIWPGFVDAMTALLLMLFFLMSIFMIVQFMLRDTINNQDSELNSLSQQVASLAEALGLEQQKSFSLEGTIKDLDVSLGEVTSKSEMQSNLIATLTQKTREQSENIDNFEAQVAALLSEKNELSTRLEMIISDKAIEISKKDALQIALSQAREETDLETEKARLAAAEADALELLLNQKQMEISEMDSSLQDALASIAATNSEVIELEISVSELNSDLDAMDKRRLIELAAKELLQSKLNEKSEKLSKEEKKRLTQMAIVESLREKLRSSTAELASMALALEEQRKRAENTLTLLAAARTVENDLNKTLTEALLNSQEYRRELEKITSELSMRENEFSELKKSSSLVETTLEERLTLALAEKLRLQDSNKAKLTISQQQSILLNSAADLLSKEKEKSAEAQLETEVLIQQVATLQKQLGSLQDLLDAAAEEASDTNVQLLTFGSNLNIALAKLAQKEKEKAKIEKAKAEVEKAKADSERAKAKLEIDNAKLLDEQAKLLQEKNTKLENFKSEFFGEIRKLLEKQEGVKISGDRFVFSSEILFSSGEAVLSEGGKKQIKQIANLILSISDKIPSNIDWILRVDGHTDDKKIRGGKYKNNWELSQARALSVVLYMQEFLNVPAYRLAATGFGEYQPVNKENSEKAREQNRRIEIKLTER